MSFRRVFRDARYVLADLADGVLSLWKAEAIAAEYRHYTRHPESALVAKEAEEEVLEPGWRPSHPTQTTYRKPGCMYGMPIPASLCATEGRPCAPICGECRVEPAACTACPRPSHRGACLDPYPLSATFDDSPQPLCIRCKHTAEAHTREGGGGVIDPCTQCDCYDYRPTVSPVAPSAGSPLSPPPTGSEGPAEDVPPTPSAGHPLSRDEVEAVRRLLTILDGINFNEMRREQGLPHHPTSAWVEARAADARVSAALTEREERLESWANRIGKTPH